MVASMSGVNGWIRRVGGLSAVVVVLSACGESAGQARDGAISVSQYTTTTTTTTTTTMPPTTVMPTSTLPPAPPVEPIWNGHGIPQPGSVFTTFAGDASVAGPKTVALTFDDGPTQYTAGILDVLKINGVKATFFNISPQTKERPEVVKRALAEGHHFGAHSKKHKELTTLDDAQKRDEIVGSADDLEAVVGPGVVTCFRPPFGDYDNSVVQIAKDRNMGLAMWSLDTLDWTKPGAGVIIDRVFKHLSTNEVVLMHDGGGDRTQTMEALKFIIPALKAKGYTFVQVC